MDDQRDAGRADATPLAIGTLVFQDPAGWQSAAVAASGRQHLDMMARTAADEHGVAEIEDLSRRARAVRQALGGPPPG